MNFMQIIFLLVALVTVFSAVMVVTVRRLMHAALWLIMTLLGVAVIFATLQASFFTVVQVLVYVGAIAILIIFAVMLTRNVMDASESQISRGGLWAIPAAGGLLAGLIVVLSTWSGFQATLQELPEQAESLSDFGLALVSPTAYAIPFEVSSVLLLAALIGAVYVAVERKAGER